MAGALTQAGLQPGDIDYINLHGTGTANNDSSEGIAIEKVFEGYTIPEASSTKAYTGHTLGAAGSVEAVFSVLAIEKQVTWPHLRMQTPISSLNWQPSTQSVAKPIRNVLSNSFGFGGNCSALVISKP
ncbi:3-oxoacyl-[acyl-carrier-protein] synthase 2 [compost metagenome]